MNTFSLYWYIALWFLYVQTMMVWFWGINLWVFAQSSVSYPKVFDLDQNHLTHREIWKVPTFIGSYHELISVILYFLMLLSYCTLIFSLYTKWFILLSSSLFSGRPNYLFHLFKYPNVYWHLIIFSEEV